MQHVAVLDEEKLLADARTGDKASFERLIEPHVVQYLYRYAIPA